MFFSTYVLTRRGPLAKVWLAAHWERKLTRNEVRVVDLTQTIVYIVHPVVPIALRTSGELLMGVVRIYALKVKHLLRDATEATMLLLRVSTTTMTKSGGGGGGRALTSSKMTTRALTAAAASAGAAGGDGDDEEGAAGAAAATDAAHSTAADLNAITLAYAATGAATSSSSSSASAAAVVDRVAEALGEAHFRAVADLLDGGAYNNGGGTRASTRGAAAAAWYSMQPSSSSGGGAGGSGGYDDMMLTAGGDGGVAQMRADLAALGERARSASTASSSNKSSLPSIEQGRGSAADGGLRPLPSVGGAGADGKGVAGDAAEVPYPSMYDDLDIGVALPDELPHALASLADAQQQQQQQSLYQGDGMPADLFTIPDLHMTTTNASATTAAAARARKLRGAAVVDLAGTTLSRGAVERAMHERGDTLNHALRHGPHDVGERRAREVLARAGDPHDAAAAHTRATRQALHNASSGTLTTTALATDLERLADVTPLSTCIVSPVLRDGFAAALQASLSEALQHVVRHAAAARAARNDSAAGANKAPLPPRPRTSATADATDVPAADEEHMMMMMMSDGCAHDAMMQPAYNDEHDAAWRKRSREALAGRRSVSHNSNSDDDGSGAARLSASAAHTLERLRTLLLASNAAGNEEQQQQRKRARADDTQHGGSDTATTTLRTLCNGMRRRVAARTFVDVLALASQQLVDAHASRNGDEVLLSLRSRATMTAATAAAAA